MNNAIRKTAVLILVSVLSMPWILHAKQARHQTTHAAITNKKMIGFASYYAAKFQGRRTASGEMFDNTMMTAAHRSLPFGTFIQVTNLRNNKSVIVRVNDRGPYAKGRIIDLTKAAAKQIGIARSGVARVKLEVLNK